MNRLPHPRLSTTTVLAIFFAGCGVTLAALLIWTTLLTTQKQTQIALVREALTPCPPLPEQKVFVGTPDQIQWGFDSITGYGISQLQLIGYTNQEGETSPVITLVASKQQVPDKLIVASNPTVPEDSVNHWLSAGYSLKLSLVGLPTFTTGTTQIRREWYLFALRKEKTKPPTSNFALFDLTAKTVDIYRQRLAQGWRMTQVIGRPTNILTNHTSDVSPMTGVVMQPAHH